MCILLDALIMTRRLVGLVITPDVGVQDMNTKYLPTHMHAKNKLIGGVEPLINYVLGRDKCHVISCMHHKNEIASAHWSTA